LVDVTILGNCPLQKQQGRKCMTSTPSASTDAVLISRPADHVALITINRPDARNAVNGDVASGLERAVNQTEADPDIWVVVLTGAGDKAFCAGADLKAVSSGTAGGLSTKNGGSPWRAAAKLRWPAT
jgi:enoyl-CoA hydratase/carnithine racemase